MKLSIVMITYNHERFIAQALSSILKQHVNFNFEIIVADDCSTDGTRAIVKNFHGRYPDKIIPLLRERNLGAMRNFKETLATCRGQYVAVLEGDDYWTCSDKVQKQVDFLDGHPDHAVCCARALFVDETVTGHSFVAPVIPAGSYTIRDLFDQNLVVTCTVMYRWGLVGSLPDWVLSLKMADWPLHILVGRSGKIRLLDEVMSVYRIHPGGAWSSLSQAEQLLASIQMLKAVDKHLGCQYTNLIRPSVARRYLELANIARFNGSRTETVRCLWKYAHIGGWRLPVSRLLASLAAYALIGSGYKVFSRANSAAHSNQEI
jgi:glycosyltransferase involved in cell wall biosynthesis